MSRNPPRSGFTLVEILVVLAILGMLLTTVWLVAGPAMRTKGMETRIRGDLRQIMVATALYEQENDGGLPRYMQSYPKGVPQGVDPYPQFSEWSFGGPIGHPDYYVTYNYVIRWRERHHPDAPYRFDPQADAFVKAPFFMRREGYRHVLVFGMPDVPGVWRTYHNDLCLGGFLDGHVAWVPTRDQWEEYYASFPMTDVPTRSDPFLPDDRRPHSIRSLAAIVPPSSERNDP